MSTNERLLKLATASPAVLAKVDAVLNGTDANTRTPDKDCRLVTFSEAARMMKLSRPTVYRLTKCGRLTLIPLNGVNRITVQSINDFVNTGSIG